MLKIHAAHLTVEGQNETFDFRGDFRGNFRGENVRMTPEDPPQY